ncbi:transposase [Acetobacter tropicalis NBRC 101654]|uniref:Transposase n=1 Tax=Acetobacter tropicalis NBRC 101654 TaxID=749388 RepID=F7VEE4_9PROT|nr:transposase [Acetobacter tropicalis NBRC 101654]
MAKGLEILPRRWIVKGTFGWMTHQCRLVKDYEQRIDATGATILTGMGSRMLG